MFSDILMFDLLPFTGLSKETRHSCAFIYLTMSNWAIDHGAWSFAREMHNISLWHPPFLRCLMVYFPVWVCLRTTDFAISLGKMMTHESHFGCSRHFQLQNQISYQVGKWYPTIYIYIHIYIYMYIHTYIYIYTHNVVPRDGTRFRCCICSFIRGVRCISHVKVISTYSKI